MPTTRPTASTLTSAALRHVRDARHLLTDGPHRSVDQANHLAGFGPECIRKAALSARWGDKILGHELGPAGDALLDTLLALDPHGCRAGALASPGAALADWRVERRYDATGAADPSATAARVSAAEVFVERVFVTLWLDGRLEDVGEW